MAALSLTRTLPRLFLAAARTATPRLVIGNIGTIGNVPSLARTLAAAATRKTTATKTTATKKAPTKKPAAAKKAAPKKKAAAKKAAPKKKPAAKKVAAKKPRKVLTEEEKAERAFAKKVKEVKQVALPRQPSPRALSVFNTYVALQMNASNDKIKLADVAQTYKSLTVQEIQDLQKEAERINAERAAAYKKWVEQYTVPEIVKANYARRWLKKNGVKRVDTSLIKDHRKPLGLRSSYIYYIQAQRTGELAGKSSVDLTVDAAKKWRSMSPAEKQPYEDLAKTDRQRYEKERASQGF